MIYKSQALDFTKNGANGLNLALGTAGNYPASSWGFNLPEKAYGGVGGLELTKETYEGATIVQWNGNKEADGAVVGPFISVATLIKNGYQIGKTYTISVWLRADYETSFNFNTLVEKQGLISISGGEEITTAWQRFSATFIAQQEISNICFYTGKGATAGAKKVYMCGIKIEEGSFATPWCPAIEDQLVANVNNDFSWKFSPTEGMFMWNGEQGDGSNSDPNLVFKVWENPSSPKDNKKELFVKGHIEATSGNISGVNMDNLAGTEEGLRENLVAKEDIDNTNVTINSTTGFLWNVTKTGTYGGLKIASSLFEPGGKYILSYRIQRTAGELVNIAGHSDGFTLIEQYINNTSFAFNNSTFGPHYGVDETNLETLGSLDQEFYVVVVLEFHGNSGEGNNNLYIQPNRDTNTPITYNIWDIKLEKIEDGEDALPSNWSPSPRDLFSWKFSSTEGMYMWKGPQTETPLLNINEDGLSFSENANFGGSLSASGTFTGVVQAGIASTIGPYSIFSDSEGVVSLVSANGNILTSDAITTTTLVCNELAAKDSAYTGYIRFGQEGKTEEVVNIEIQIIEDSSTGQYNFWAVPQATLTRSVSLEFEILHQFVDLFDIEYNKRSVYGRTVPSGTTQGEAYWLFSFAKTIRDWAGLIKQNYNCVLMEMSYTNEKKTYVNKRLYAGSDNTITISQTSRVGVPTITCNGHLVPAIGTDIGQNVDNGYDLGAKGEDYSWNNIYTRTSAIGQSDKNLKKDIVLSLEDYEPFYDQLLPVNYKFIKGSSNRKHIGFIAQDVKQALEKSKLTTLDFAGYCDWIDRDGVFGCGLRYEEFIPLNTWQIQKLKPRMASAEEKLLAYESRISTLEKEIENLKKS